MTSTTALPTPIICPACGGENDHDAVFCADARCHKALGEFGYVLEELKAEARWHEVLADRVTGFISKPYFLGIHAVWFVLWVAVNAGVIAMVHRFDEYPFPLLGIVLACETIFITGFLLISQNRENQHATKRAELDYEVNVKTYRLISEMNDKLNDLTERLNRLEAK